jgi:hypothetical protein
MRKGADQLCALAGPAEPFACGFLGRAAHLDVRVDRHCHLEWLAFVSFGLLDLNKP